MEALIQKLYDQSYALLHLGEKGTLIYAEEYIFLNSEVARLSARLSTYVSRSQEEEGWLCLVLLMSYLASYTTFQKEKSLSKVLDRVDVLLFGDHSRCYASSFQDSLIRCQLAVYAYTFTYEEGYAREAHRIISQWRKQDLNSREIEFMELLENAENYKDALPYLKESE